jgi:hypothetical protein
MVDEYDLYQLEDDLFDLIRSHKLLDLVVVSQSSKKSLRIFNISKGLIDLGAKVYWYVDQDFFKGNCSFALIDKTYVISTADHLNVSSEEVFREYNDLFNSKINLSDCLNLMISPIEVDFTSDETFVQAGQDVTLKWTVNNALSISINDEFEDLDPSGEILVSVDRDSSFHLIARNNESVVKKSLFIRVLQPEELVLTVHVYDQILEDYIKLSPLTENSNNLDAYAVYASQPIQISWSINSHGKFTEKTFGELPLVGKKEIVVTEEIKLIFNFKSIRDSVVKKIHFFPVSSSVANSMEDLSEMDINATVKESKELKVSPYARVKTWLQKRFNQF